MLPEFIEILNTVNPDIMENQNANLIEEGLIDSLDIMNIISEVVSQLGVYIDPEEVTPETFSTVQSMWELVRKSVKNKND